ncbi:DPP IV N-terminal domain-containing protein [Litorimonas sp. RW-G-Af-16]|uniref:S9 family peptidase n=1 Tax=Litorimonas sp. RW-G-Af-16 TaxID=3241168 RepID=UPI00390C50B0
MFSAFKLPLTALLASTALLVAACDKAPENPNLRTEKSDLQKAAEKAQTPVTQQSYLTENPEPGYLTPERINQSPSLSGKRLSAAKIAPSGDFVTVLQGRADNAQQQDLWAYDLSTGEGRLLVSSTDLLGAPEELSAEEKNRRERARIYGTGIISYNWVGENLLLFPLGGDIYLYDLETEESQQVTATKGFETDPKVSKNGELVAYVRGNELYVKSLETGLERQLTDGSTDTIRNATASFVVQEELDRNTGYWLSPDASKVAYTQIDEADIIIENRIEFGADGVENVSQRYPFTGTKNATIKLGVVSTKGGRTTWVDIGDDPDVYLTRVAWAPNNRTMFVGILARDNKTHTFYKVDSRTGQSEIFYEETSPTWLNIGTYLRATEDGGLLWTAERNDKRQLFKIAADGTINALTPESLMMRNMLCLKDDTAYVSGWQDDPLSTHIFKINLAAATPAPATPASAAGEDETTPATAPDGDGMNAPLVTQMTEKAGQNYAAFNKDCSRYLGYHSDVDTPTQLRAYGVDGTGLAWLNENPLDATHPYAPFLANHITPQFGQIEAEDGTPLDYMIYLPKDLKPGEKRASVTIVYGGPGVQRIRNSWGNTQAQMLAHHGFVVFMLENRGATNRGKAFEDVLYRSMGVAEVKDQSLGANWLKAQSFIDPDRMGIYGWSYGGYMTLHMLAQTDLYASGVSGAPVTDFRLYDTAYTERYLGDPNEGTPNYTEGAYDNASVFTHLDGLDEPVLLIHGMADDNVVFRHSIKLMDKMQENAQHNLRIMTYPGEKHGFRKEANRIHRDRSILEFFLETLDIYQE